MNKEWRHLITDGIESKNMDKPKGGNRLAIEVGAREFDFLISTSSAGKDDTLTHSNHLLCIYSDEKILAWD